MEARAGIVLQTGDVDQVDTQARAGIAIRVGKRAQLEIKPNVPVVQVPAAIEVDPTVPEWVKERASPEFRWSEITGKPQDLGNMELEQLIKQMGGL